MSEKVIPGKISSIYRENNLCLAAQNNKILSASSFKRADAKTTFMSNNFRTGEII